MHKDQAKTYSTKDLGEASLLLAKKLHLNVIERQGRVCWFVFANEQLCRELSNSFWFGECLVDAKTYYESMAILKNRIFSYE